MMSTQVSLQHRFYFADLVTAAVKTLTVVSLYEHKISLR